MSRATKPYAEVKTMLGDSSTAWEKLTGHIRYYYMLDEVWDPGKPTNKNYNNLYFRRGGKTLIGLCLREGYFIAYLVLGKNERAKFDEQRAAFGEAMQKEYDRAEVYHDGKCIGFDVYDDGIIDDIIRLLPLKRKPNRKVLPDSLERCGCIDIGMAHEDITELIVPVSL